MHSTRKLLAGALSLCLALGMISPALAAGLDATYYQPRFTSLDWLGTDKSLNVQDGRIVAEIFTRGRGLVDRQGKTVLPFDRYSYLNKTDRGTYLAVDRELNSYLVRPDGTVVQELGHRIMSVTNGGILVDETEDEYQYYHGDMSPATLIDTLSEMEPEVREALAQVIRSGGQLDSCFRLSDNLYMVNSGLGYLKADGSWLTPLDDSDQPDGPVLFQHKVYVVKGQGAQASILAEDGTVTVAPGTYTELETYGMLVLGREKSGSYVILTPLGEVAARMDRKPGPSGLGQLTRNGYLSVSGADENGMAFHSSLYQNGELVRQYEDRELFTMENSDLIYCATLTQAWVEDVDGNLVAEDNDESFGDVWDSGLFTMGNALYGPRGQVLIPAGKYVRLRNCSSFLAEDGVLVVWAEKQDGTADTYYIDRKGARVLGYLERQAGRPDDTGLFAFKEDGKWGLAQLKKSLPAPETGAPAPWAQGFVDQALQAELVPAGFRYAYNGSATRRDFCALAVRLYEKATGSQVTDLADFPDSTDLNIRKAAALGVISGIEEDGVLMARPNDTLTREQAAIMLCGLAKACQKPLARADASFADIPASGWSQGFIGQVQKAGIMSGVEGGRFAPNDSYTVEQSILTMLKLYQNLS